MNPEATPLDCSRRSAARRRRDPRSTVALTCQLRVGGGPWRPASLVDLSQSGFRIAWLPSASIGSSLWVRIPGFEAMPATVRWRDMGGVGCQLARPLSQAVFEHISRKASAMALGGAMPY
jgi:hypothetical protein